jgi:hypothetical protein
MNLIKLFFELLLGLVKLLSDKQLIQAGKAEQLNEVLLAEREKIEKATISRNTVKHNADSLQNDKNNRK